MTLFKRIRIAILLYVLLFVAASQVVTSMNSTDWDTPLWVDVYLSNADGSENAQNYIDALTVDEFTAIETFFSREAPRFGINVDPPLRFMLGTQLQETVPVIPDGASLAQTVIWSLKMRWLTTKLNWQSDRPSPDVVLFASFHDAEGEPVLDRSGALRKGLIAVANLFADRRARATNQVVIAHELLHTLGATDKYERANNQPLFPLGFAEPDANPLYPQQSAEIMAGRIPLSATEAQIPGSLNQVTIGATTAAEIGWTKAR
jgi:hypothetical protein